MGQVSSWWMRQYPSLDHNAQVQVRHEPEHGGEPLGLQHREWLAPLLASRWAEADPPEATLSDPWFANLFLFRRAHDWWVIRGAQPRVCGRAYDGTRLVLPLFDLAAVPRESLRGLLAGGDAFGPFSAAQAARLPGSQFRLVHNRDDADYLFPADNFLHYRGRILNKKRNQVRQLLARHAVHAVPYEAARMAEALQVLDAWLAGKGLTGGAADDGPCREALSLAAMLGLQGLLFRVDGEPAGFVLGQPIRPGVHVVRFAKGTDRFIGLYPFMFQQYCVRSEARWLNFEQDLGHANFRHAKMAYRPAALLQKVRAVPVG